MSVWTGQFAPVQEELTLTELPVTGTIPDHLDGRYVRIGPNPQGDLRPDHLFMGAGMAHGVRLRDGRAEWYRNRWVRSEELSLALGERPRPGKKHAGFDFSANTNVVAHGGKTLALVEGGPRPYELTDELETVGICDFDGTLPGGYAAHPHSDPATGELHALSYFFGWGDKIRYSVLTPEGRIRRTVDIGVGGSPMIHDFALTEHHIVVFDLPVTFDAELAAGSAPRLLARPARSLLSRVVGHHPIPEPVVAAVARRGTANGTGAMLPYRWNPERPARVGVMPREGGSADVRWFEVQPCYVFHSLNAYEEDGKIVIDLVRHPRMFATDTVPGEESSSLDRWTIDPASGKVHEERLDDRPQEFPRFDERLLGRRARYGYTVATPPFDGRGTVPDLHADSVIKHDLRDGRSETHRFAPGSAAGEFVFVPAGAGEENGVLMGYVTDTRAGKTDLVLIDAETLELVASVHLPVRVPSGFHGNWMPA